MRTKLPTKGNVLAQLRVNNKAVIRLNVTNHGMSDQIHDDIKLRIHNANFLLSKSDDGSLYQKSQPGIDDLLMVDAEASLEQEILESIRSKDYTPEY